ncbi:MAG: MFS transporter [Rhodopila sp.]
MLQGRGNEAADVIHSLQPGLAEAQVGRMVQEIEARAHGMGEAPDWRAFLAPSIRGITLFAMMAFLLQQVSGINAVIYYAPRILHSGGFGTTSEQLLGTVGIGAINVVMTFVAIATVDRLKAAIVHLRLRRQDAQSAGHRLGDGQRCAAGGRAGGAVRLISPFSP